MTAPTDPTANQPQPTSRRTFLKRGALGLFAAGLPSGLATTHWLSIEQSELHLPNWTGPAFRVGFIADLHIDSEADVDLTIRAIRAAIRFEPHVIVLGGDYLTENPPEKVEMLTRALKPLEQARCPVVGILGNHDYWGGREDVTVAAVCASGIVVLRNEEVEVGGVRLLGFDDGFYGNPNYEAFAPSDKPAIVLLHEPDLVRYAPMWGSLQLSGHSHGGQICLPGGIPLMGTTEAEKYISGYFPHARVPLYVTRGIGTRRISVRYWCRPEVSLLTLSSLA